MSQQTINRPKNAVEALDTALDDIRDAIDSNEPILEHPAMAELQNAAQEIGGKVVIIDDAERFEDNIFCISIQDVDTFISRIKEYYAQAENDDYLLDQIAEMLDLVFNAAIRLNDFQAITALFKLKRPVIDICSPELFGHLEGIESFSSDQFTDTESDELMELNYRFQTAILPHIKLVLNHPEFPADLEELEAKFHAWDQDQRKFETKCLKYKAYAEYCKMLYVEALSAAQEVIQSEIDEVRNLLSEFVNTEKPGVIRHSLRKRGRARRVLAGTDYVDLLAAKQRIHNELNRFGHIMD